MGVCNLNKYKLTASDIADIESVLNSGNDVRLQTTAYGYRIVADKVTVLKKISHDGTPLMSETPTRNRGNGVK